MKNRFNFFLKFKKKNRNFSKFFDIGFHGDIYLGEIILYCLLFSSQYIETGFNVGSSLLHAGKKTKNIKIFGCEPDKKAYMSVLGRANSQKYILYNKTSRSMLDSKDFKNSVSFDKDTVFWLDAHDYGYEWSLEYELEYILKNFKKGYIFIDDFMVPGNDLFKYYKHGSKECSYLEFKNILEKRDILYFYPKYKEKTSNHHPLIGWGLIEFGHQDFRFNEKLEKLVIKYKKND